MKLLEEGASVIEWIAIVRPSSKNRALAAGTRRLVATARTRYLGFGTVKTEPLNYAPSNSDSNSNPNYQQQRRQSSSGSLVPPAMPMPQRNGSWEGVYTQSQSLVQGQYSDQPRRPDTSPSNSMMSGSHFDWNSFPIFSNTPSQLSNGPMQMLPVGQLSPIDLSLPLSSPNQGISMPMPDHPHGHTFGHLPTMPNQMDNWPMSMQNLGQLGNTPAPDPYAPSSEGFDMWLASILSDGGQGSGQSNGNDDGQGYQ
jgi:hypothetical protein